MGAVELQAVVMAGGKGSRMAELTVKRPKCLLPVGNLPLLYYPLQLLERTGFQDVIIVITEPTKADVQSALDKCGLKIKYELVGIPSEDWGTGDSLRYLEENNKIKTDVLVVSCDLITNASLSPLLDMYRKHDSALTAMFVEPQNLASFQTPGPKSKSKTERDFIGINEQTSRLVLLTSASDYEEEVPLSSNLLKRYGRFTLYSKLLDAHVYIISKWLCEYLVQNKSFSTLKGELLPYIVKKHTYKNKIPVEDKASEIGIDLKTVLELSNFSENNCVDKIRSMSSYTDYRCQPVYKGDAVRCYAHILKNTFAIRANTVQNYCMANRQIIENWKKLVNNKELVNVSSQAVVKSTQLDINTCLVGEKAMIAEKTSFKNSIIGPGVSISSKSSIKDSLVMSGAKIGQGCNIQNCIICEESIIEDNCDLKDCLIGSHHKVVGNCKHSSELLTDKDRYMEI